MIKPITKTSVAAVIFVLAEAIPFHAIIDAMLFANRIGFPGYAIVAWGVGLLLSSPVSWLLFKKWNAKLWVKAGVAATIFVTSFFILGMLAVSIMQRSAINNPPY